MATLTPGPQWYLFDYGMVISTAPEEADWLALEEAAGLNLRQVDSAYWLHRLQYDEGRISSRDYWTRVVGSAVSEGRAMELARPTRTYTAPAVKSAPKRARG